MGRTTGTGLTGTHRNRARPTGGPPSGRRRARSAAAVAALAALGLAACSSENDQAATANTDAPAEFAAEEPADEPAAEPADQAEFEPEPEPESDSAAAPAASTGGATVTAGSSGTGLPIDQTPGRDLAFEVELTMSTPNVATTVESIVDAATERGGYVSDRDVDFGAPLEDGSVPGGGTIVVKIAPAQLDPLVNELSGIARISNMSQATDDVTEQLIDLEIRIRQARTGIANIEVLFAQATEFGQLVEIERELARRQIELEQLLAAERGVEGRVDESTLTITVAYEPPAPAGEEAVEEPVDEESDRGIGDAFRDGWDAFAGVMFAVGFVLAVAAPFLVLALVVALLAWGITRLFGRGRRLPPVETSDERELVGSSHDD